MQRYGELPLENDEFVLNNGRLFYNSRYYLCGMAVCRSPGLRTTRMRMYSCAQVSFQWKNSDFLLRNPDSLLRNPDSLLKNVDFIIKPGAHGAATLTTELHPDDPSYLKVGSLFVQTAMEEYGDPDGRYHFVDGGTWFDEGNTATLNTSYVASVAARTYAAMVNADPDAIWVDSAWRFGSTGAFWQANGGENMKAFLTAIPKGRHVARNVAAARMLTSLNGRNDTYLWNASDGFFNTSWIYGQLQNFGGKPGIYGRLDTAARAFPQAFAESPSLQGIGTASEAIEQNPVAVDVGIKL